VDSFVIFGPDEVPAVVSYDLEFTPTGPLRILAPSSDDPLDPTNLSGQFRDALATGYFTASSVTEPGGEPFSITAQFASSEFAWAEMGMMRNGSFNRQ